MNIQRHYLSSSHSFQGGRCMERVFDFHSLLKKGFSSNFYISYAAFQKKQTICTERLASEKLCEHAPVASVI